MKELTAKQEDFVLEESRERHFLDDIEVSKEDYEHELEECA